MGKTKMDALTQTRKAAYKAACLADNMWSDELERVYGKDAGDARYDNKRNAATPMLKTLREIKRHADNAWHLLGMISRQEIAA